MLLRLPVSIYNTGARSRVICELRLVIPHDEFDMVLRWNDFRKTLTPSDKDKDPDFLDHASIYAIPGRTAVEKFVTFRGVARDSHWPLEPKDHKVLVQARIDGSLKWETISQFTLHLWHVADNLGSYITCRNTSETCDEREQSRAREAFLAAAERWGISCPAWASKPNTK